MSPKPRRARRPSPRPRFELRTSLPPSEVRERVTAAIRASDRLRGLAQEHRIELAIDAENHFWSPQIVADVKASNDGGAVLDCRFGPDPYVWALYLLLYGTILFGAFFALLFGFVQLSLGQTPLALYLAPGALVLAGLVYGASFVGQGLGSDQMYFLRAELTRAVDAEESATDSPKRAT